MVGQDWSNKRAAERFLGGLEGNRVRSRLARYHYGIVTQVKYERGHHSKSQRIWCKLEECWKVDGIMEWFIEKVKFLGNSLVYGVYLLTRVGNIPFGEQTYPQKLLHHTAL